MSRNRNQRVFILANDFVPFSVLMREHFDAYACDTHRNSHGNALLTLYIECIPVCNDTITMNNGRKLVAMKNSIHNEKVR